MWPSPGGLALCRLGKRVRFTTAAALVTELEEAQQQHRLDRTLAAMDRLDMLIVDELGYLSFSRAGAGLLFQVFADRYERRSLLVTSNLPFSEWGSVFQVERMAEHGLLKRACAVKFIRPELAANPATAARFAREVKAVTGLSHVNTVRVYDYGRAEDGSVYLVMEYLDGPTLEELVRTTGP